MGNNLSSQMESGQIMNSADKIKLWDLRNKTIKAEGVTERPMKVWKGRCVTFDLDESDATSLVRNNSSNDASCEDEGDSPSPTNSVEVVICDRILETEYKRYMASRNQKLSVNAVRGFDPLFTSCAPPVRELIAEPGFCLRCFLPRVDCLCLPHSDGCPKYAFRSRIGVSGICPSCLFNPSCSGCSFCTTCFGYEGCMWCAGCDWCRFCSNYMGCKYYTHCTWCNFCAGCSWCQYCVGRVAYDHDNPRYWERGPGWVRFIDV